MAQVAPSHEETNDAPDSALRIESQTLEGDGLSPAGGPNMTPEISDIGVLRTFNWRKETLK